MRKSSMFLGLLVSQALLIGLVFIDAFQRSFADRASFAVKKEIVRALGITDLCLFTEANYTRHLSQADIHTPFQDHPFSLEHFPSGSILMPPLTVRRMNVTLD